MAITDVSRDCGITEYQGMHFIVHSGHGVDDLLPEVGQVLLEEVLDPKGEEATARIGTLGQVLGSEVQLSDLHVEWMSQSV